MTGIAGQKYNWTAVKNKKVEQRGAIKPSHIHKPEMCPNLNH